MTLHDLIAVLDRHDRARALQGPVSEDEARAEVRRAFGLDFASFRDHELRVALEEVVWQLEKRGHHAWLQDHGEAVAADVTGAGDQRIEAPRPLSLRLLPVDQGTDLRAAAEMRFVPDTGRAVVHVDAWFGDPRQASVERIAHGIELVDLDEARIFALATTFVGRLLDPGAGPEATG